MRYADSPALNSGRQKRIVLGVTDSVSLRLMRGFPERLADEGWDVHVVSGGILPPAPEGITFHSLPMRREPRPLADSLSLVAWVLLLIKLKPDVVSTGTPKAGLLGMLSAWLTRVPVRIYKLRGLRLESAAGVQRKLLTRMERLTMACATSIITVSPSLQDRTIELRLSNPEKLVTLGKGSSNGVDLTRFDPSADAYHASRRTLELPQDQTVIGFVGRLRVDKGIPELLDATIELTKRGYQFVLLLVGGTEEEVCNQLVDDARASGANIIEIGFVEEPADVFQAIDVLCLPTHREGFPNVVLEAGACATPAVTTTATGAIDSVVHEHTGLIAQVRDSQSLANELERLLVEPKLRALYGRNAREFVESNFRNKDVWAREISLFNSTLPKYS